MDFGPIWGIIAALAVVGGWLSYRTARRAGRGTAAGCLIGFLITLAIIVLLSMIVTLLQRR